VTIIPLGGDPVYTFAVNSAAYSTTNPIINLPAGNHTLHVKDANGCVLDTALTITQPSGITPTATVTQPLCYGGANGQIQMSASGGTPGYTYALGTGAYGSSNTFTGLNAGTYTVHTKDANSCVQDLSVIIGQPTKLIYDSIIKSDLLCYGDNSGKVQVYASGGTTPYKYAFDGTAYSTLNPVTGITAGNHVIHVQDANGCVHDTTLNFKQPPPLHFRVPGITQPTCEGMTDGAITIAAFGGTPRYLYAMDPQPLKPVNTYSGLGEGAYTFHVQDSNGCQLDTTVVLTGNPHIVLGDPELTPPSCYGFNNGVIDLNVTGGVPPLTYHVVKPNITNSNGVFDTLRKGTYQIQVVDAKGCHNDTTLFLDEPDPLSVKASATPNDCVGVDDNGVLGVSVDGGTQPYSYTWINCQNTDIVQCVPIGAYWVTVVDAHLCADSALAVVGYDNCCKPFLPDAFTPNGDGKNDIFRLRWKGDVYNLNFSIYNRYGERVFVSYQPDVGWDGTFHGKPVDMDVYFYDIKFDCGMKDGNRVEYKGDVTLIR
jgi:gliding motility-associated-like protein